MRQNSRDSGSRMDNTPSLLETVHEISHEISIHLASEQVLQKTCQRLADMLTVDYVLAVRGDQVLGEGTIIAEYPARLEESRPLTLEGFAAYRQLQTDHKPVVIEHVDAGADLLGPNQSRFQSLDLQVLFLAPLVAQDDLVGFVMLGTGTSGRTFSQDERYATQTVAAQLAISLRNADLSMEIQHRASQLDQIAAFGRLITSTLDRDQILQHVVEVVPHLLAIDQLSVARLTAGQSRMRVITLNRGAAPQEEEWAAAGSGVEEVVQTQNPMLVPDLQTSTYIDHRGMREQGMRSALIVPLTVSGRAFGAVTARHRRVRMYTTTDLALFQQIGNQIAIALENAHQFQATREHVHYEESLGEITSHLQQQTELHLMLQQIMQDLGQVLGARRARVRLQVTPLEPGGTKLSE
jgi:GAF domain-containing protein